MLGRIIAGSLAVSALMLAATPGVAAAAPVAVAPVAVAPVAVAPAPQTPPDTEPDPNPDPNPNPNPDPDPDPDPDPNPNPDPDPDPNPNPNPNPRPTAARPAPAAPTVDPRVEEQKRLAEEQRKRDKELAEAARKEAERVAKAAERARRDAIERAEQAAKARASWNERGKPHQMITIRLDRVEVVDEGRLLNLQPRSPGVLTLSALDRLVPADWIKIDGGTATVSAAIVLTPDAALQIGDDTPTVRLAGGPEIPDAAPIYTGGGRLTLRGVTITSFDPNTQQPPPAESPGRPFIEVAGQGKLDATDATISDMGMPPVGQEGARPGVSFNPGSTGSLVRTTLERNNIGVELSRSERVNLDGVTVRESVGDGIVLNADKGTTMTALRAEGNGGNGMFVGGREAAGRTVSGLTTVGNELYGIVVTEQTGAQITGIVTEADKAGGLRLNQATDVTVTDFSATDQPIAVFTHVGSRGIVLDNIRASGGRRGVVVEKSTENLELRNSTIEGSRVAGVNIGGKDVRVNSVQVTDAKAGVRLERGSGHIQLTGVTIDGGRDGIVASAGAADVVITDLIANGVGDDAVRTASPGARINGGTITGGTTGMDVAAATTISAVTINGASEGIHARSLEPVRAENVEIDATDLGLNVAVNTPFVLANSSVHALEAVRGQFTTEGTNNISLPPLNLLAAMGMPLILLAIVLEQVHSFRQRSVGGNKRRMPPPVPVGVG